MEVFAGDKPIGNWIDFIEVMFDNETFQVELTEDIGSKKYEITNDLDDTKLFLIIDEDPLNILAIGYENNSDYHRPLFDDLEFTGGPGNNFDQNVVDDNINYFERVLVNGIEITDYLLFNTLAKSSWSYPPEGEKKFPTYHNNFGCMTILFFPIYIPINLMLHAGWIGKRMKFTWNPILVE